MVNILDSVQIKIEKKYTYIPIVKAFLRFLIYTQILNTVNLNSALLNEFLYFWPKDVVCCLYINFRYYNISIMVAIVMMYVRECRDQKRDRIRIYCFTSYEDLIFFA